MAKQEKKKPTSKRQAKHLRKLADLKRGKISPTLGKHFHSEESKVKIRFSKIAEKNPMWRGNNVGYMALHAWVKRNILKPKLCQCCKKVPPYDLANKGIYDRNLKNWEWLCRKCHMIKDGRMQKVKEGIAKKK